MTGKHADKSITEIINYGEAFSGIAYVSMFLNRWTDPQCFFAEEWFRGQMWKFHSGKCRTYDGVSTLHSSCFMKISSRDPEESLREYFSYYIFLNENFAHRNIVKDVRCMICTTRYEGRRGNLSHHAIMTSSLSISTLWRLAPWSSSESDDEHMTGTNNLINCLN